MQQVTVRLPEIKQDREMLCRGLRNIRAQPSKRFRAPDHDLRCCAFALCFFMGCWGSQDIESHSTTPKPLSVVMYRTWVLGMVIW